ncbi:hypothetical protein [Chromobacterium sphagni]|uniref:Uncharacterized protein n=2 Tax=Chromobacterium sphagni TaxID=1903179 RepID=A0A1S1X2K4_9NEIS|nr:hypothetical protein [Chromobacterium sphagni]OHX13744.1 hypothetical protein BI347_09625 [Chromobacterium sphagni]OHX18120.1 hypothetical protein BI344_11345 [Chromobacterium sphagni]
MSLLLWWSIEFPARTLSCLLDGWRCQQQYWRSSLFHGARVCLSPAPLPDKLARLARRGCADGIALCYDGCQPRFAWLEHACLNLPQCGCAREEWQNCLHRSRQALQQGLLQLGREWSRL